MNERRHFWIAPLHMQKLMIIIALVPFLPPHKYAAQPTLLIEMLLVGLLAGVSRKGSKAALVKKRP